MERLLWVAGMSGALWALSCVLMVVLAARLPDGLLKQVAAFLPACVRAARTLRRDPAVPRRARVALLLAAWPTDPRLLERVLGRPPG